MEWWQAVLFGAGGGGGAVGVLWGIFRFMGGRLLALHDQERQELKESIERLSKKMGDLSTSIRSEIQENEKEWLQKWSDLPKNYVPRRELELRVSNLLDSQQNTNKMLEDLNKSVRSLTQTIIDRMK